jgi:hypothetical protein
MNDERAKSVQEARQWTDEQIEAHVALVVTDECSKWEPDCVLCAIAFERNLWPSERGDAPSG